MTEHQVPEPRACARCAAAFPAVLPRSAAHFTADKPNADRRYPRTALAALRLVADGYRIFDPSNSELEFLAVTSVAGTLLCGVHAAESFQPVTDTPRSATNIWESLRGR